jgi:glycosyltransferase involved in cell wall biosynthesis
VITEDWFFVSHFFDRAAAAVRAGFDVAVATRAREKASLIARAGIRIYPIEFSRRGLNPLTELLTALRVRRIVREFRPDIVHNIALKPVVTGSVGARLGGAKRIINAPVGMGYAFTSAGDGSRVLRGCLSILLRQLLCAPQGCVIVENADDLRELVDAGFARADRVRLIQGAGVDTQAFAPEPEPPGPVTVLLVARMLKDKGVVEFVDAARRVRTDFPGTRFVLVGEPDPGNPTSLRIEDIQRWVGEGHVEYLGFRDDIAELLRRCHIACLPSYREGLPKSLLEAAASGRPIVTTDVPGCRSVVEDGVNGLLVPARNSEALARAISLLVGDRSLRESLGRSGRNRALDCFSSDSIVAQTLKVYREILDA